MGALDIEEAKVQLLMMRLKCCWWHVTLPRSRHRFDPGKTHMAHMELYSYWGHWYNNKIKERWPRGKAPVC